MENGSFPSLQRKVSSTLGSREDALHHLNLPTPEVLDTETERLSRDMELLQRLLAAGGEAASEAASLVARKMQRHVSQLHEKAVLGEKEEIAREIQRRIDEGEGLEEMEGMLEEAMYLGWVEFADDDPEERVEYVGQMLSGIRYGLGSMRWKDGTRYDGEWRYDQVLSNPPQPSH
ncbi:hypothetical protein T484DRAFT_1807538 [Baffinella frigidus]|nr:hypothetical protein T484DRAFT_1807538 [Cryptophyta sp. CCMP2293]